MPSDKKIWGPPGAPERVLTLLEEAIRLASERGDDPEAVERLRVLLAEVEAELAE